MAKAPSPLKEFIAQTRKAVGAFFVGAVGTVGTAVSAVYATTGQVDRLDYYALAVAAAGAGLAAATAIYKVGNRAPSTPGPLPEPPPEGGENVLPITPDTSLDPAVVQARISELLAKEPEPMPLAAVR